jgi:hypothetical protein
MEKLINYTSSDDIRGHLEVIKVHSDGTEELHFSDDNVICSGMGLTLLKAFEADNSGLINNYQIVYFQLGNGGSLAYQVSSNGALGAALLEENYGTTNFELSVHDLQASGVVTSGIFGVIPFAYIKRTSPTRVTYQMTLDETSLDNQWIREIGLFSKNPLRLPTDTSFLCAYRYFGPLYKTAAISVIIRWTLDF